jgi:Mpv17 / PMP22 family
LFAVLTTPINFFFQSWLEYAFPARPAAPHPKKSDEKPQESKLSIRNTVIKIVLDQTLAATFNTLAFSTYMRGVQAAMTHAPKETSLVKAIRFWNAPGAIQLEKVDWAGVWRIACDEFWGIYVTGLKFWPAVSVANYVVVKDVPTRNMVGGMAGIVWGTYMSLLANA